VIINPYIYIEKEIPKLHPLSYEYVEYWTEQKRRCIEGYWQGGRWMPGPLYHYLNFANIKLNKGRTSNTKSIGRPLPLDFLWEVEYSLQQCRGFAGFEKQQEVQDLKIFLDKNIYDDEIEESIRSKMINPRDTLWTTTESLGKPLYLNEAKDFMWMGGRGTGKSWYISDRVAHEFTFDGQKEYINPQDPNYEQLSTEIIVSAYDAKYSADTLGKAKFIMDNYPGSMMIGDKLYPSPFSKITSGSLQPSKELVHAYKKKIGGQWKEGGSKSKIKHRTYADNPFASQGSRASIILKEEIGMFSNLIATQQADEEVMKIGTRKFGTCIYIGTGGDMDKGTIDAKRMFNDPETYNLLSFIDDYENKGKIAYFLPAHKGKIEYKDELGNTREEYALQKELDQREKKKKGKNGVSALKAYVQYNPLKPSEIFLANNGNIFPQAEAMETLSRLEANDNYLHNETIVELYFDPKSETGVNYKVDLERKLQPITEFPTKSSDSKEGAVIIYEFPVELDGKVPNDMYIIGHDPYRTEGDEGSMGGIYVFKNRKYLHKGHYDEIVAEYIGRPSEGRRKINEILEQLWMLYGSPPQGIYFESEVGNTLEYFQKRKKLNALASKPELVLSTSAAYTKSGRLLYGYPMSSPKMKGAAEQYLYDWFMETRGTLEDDTKVLNVHGIKSRYLLKQIMLYNRDGNFDAVMAFAGCIIGLNEKYNQYIKQTEETKVDEITSFFVNNGKLFKNKNIKQTFN